MKRVVFYDNEGGISVGLMRVGTALNFALVAAACTQSVVRKEDMLAAAGFDFRPADTSQRIEALRALPPHRFVRQERNGQTVWIYADPTICGCLYVGDQKAYGTYKRQVFEKRIADERLMSAEYENAAAVQMDWRPWGPWAPYYYY